MEGKSTCNNLVIVGSRTSPNCGVGDKAGKLSDGITKFSNAMISMCTQAAKQTFFIAYCGSVPSFPFFQRDY